MDRNLNRHLAPLRLYAKAREDARVAVEKARSEVEHARGEGEIMRTLSASGKPSAEAASNLAKATAKAAALKFKDRIPFEFNGKDYVTFLLSIDAEIEHGLMLEYLYGAYSLGGSQVPADYRDDVRQWQEIILGVAKEEMGHFISVQNVLRAIGGALNFGRQDYPWDTPFYPFPFKLERLTLDSLAKYIYAESPEGWIDNPKDPVAVDAKRRLNMQVSNPVRVGELFAVLLELIQDPEVIPDSAFQANTYPFQAKFDEWGRNYTGGQRGNASGGNPKGAPDVLVAPLTSRDDAYNALDSIAEQGEATTKDENSGLPSHFMRFHKIYKRWLEIDKATGGKWSPSRNVATNPYIEENDSDLNSAPSDGLTSDEEHDPITNPEAKLWAHLFNTRYRLLLNFLTHSFMLDDGFNNSGARTPRGAIINSTFGEMYNLRSIATVLVDTPLRAKPLKPDDGRMAGPPFTIPYTLLLPMGESNRWGVHKDCLEASARIVDALLPLVSERNRQYLYSLREADGLLLNLIQAMSSAAV